MKLVYVDEYRGISLTGAVVAISVSALMWWGLVRVVVWVCGL